ncbi:hypothetical protein H0H93_002244 [Arthromyces matolae]|nr:hypothetical protein H0H93_002244 [Arthromyces matolae]
MGWFNEDSIQALAYSAVTKESVDVSWNVALIAAAAAYEASKAYENEFAKNNRAPSEENGKAILNNALKGFIDNIVPELEDFDREKAKEDAKKQAEDALYKLGGIDPRKIVSKKTLEELNKERMNANREGYVVFEAPAEDMKEMENLLGVDQGILGSEHFIEVPEGMEHCAYCGRHYSFLDMASTGVAAHKGSFMKDVLTGKYGYINNVPRSNRAFNCYKCGKRAPFIIEFYWCPIYGG